MNSAQLPLLLPLLMVEFMHENRLDESTKPCFRKVGGTKPTKAQSLHFKFSLPEKIEI